jgi:hypothetical protein
MFFSLFRRINGRTCERYIYYDFPCLVTLTQDYFELLSFQILNEGQNPLYLIMANRKGEYI